MEDENSSVTRLEKSEQADEVSKKPSKNVLDRPDKLEKSRQASEEGDKARGNAPDRMAEQKPAGLSEKVNEGKRGMPEKARQSELDAKVRMAARW